ncbi:MAG: radical SAM protein [Dehalococcoidia bacterium]
MPTTGRRQRYLLDLGGGAAVEAVRMSYDPEDDSMAGRTRTTICVSTQVGCAMGCVFCATGQQGFTRNLTTSEILAQVLHFVRESRASGIDRVTNIVFMGMGEPLANYAHTLEAVRWLVDEHGLTLRQRGITIDGGAARESGGWPRRGCRSTSRSRCTRPTTNCATS